jgi:hypothetical protein
MSSLCLRLLAHGDAFDVDAYLASSPLQFDQVWHKGDLICGGEHYPTSGVEKSLDEGSSGPPLQDRTAVEFLSAHREALRELGAFPGVETFILGLYLSLPRGFAGTCVGPSPGLMWHCLDVGLTPLFYLEGEYDDAVATNGVQQGVVIRRWRRRKAERRR